MSWLPEDLHRVRCKRDCSATAERADGKREDEENYDRVRSRAADKSHEECKYRGKFADKMQKEVIE